MFVTIDVGNMNVKFRPQGGKVWAAEAALVTPAIAGGFQFTASSGPRSLRYRSGPAQIRDGEFFVGNDARTHGAGNVAMIGSARLRAATDAYLLLHLWGIIASLPKGITAPPPLAFAGGVPAADFGADGKTPAVTTLKARLKGTHVLSWGAATYTITIDKILIVPQAIGPAACAVLTPTGQVRPDALTAQRAVLVIGGGTTEHSVRLGLDLRPGTEGSVAYGMAQVAERTCALLRSRHAGLATLTTRDVLGAIQERGIQATVQLAGRPHLIGDCLASAASGLVDDVLAALPRAMIDALPQSEVILAGGAMRELGDVCKQRLRAQSGACSIATAPLYAVAEGIERLARFKLAA